MPQKIKKIANYVIKNISDVSFLGQIGIVIIALLVSWSTAKAIQQNYDLQKQVAQAEKENELQELKNSNLKIKNQYLETDEYLELAARRHLGMAAPGETLIIIPKGVAISYTAEGSIETDDDMQKNIEGSKPFYQKNLEAWGRFFFRK